MTRAREKFDRFMVANANGHNLKLARFTDAEFRALVQGILPIASMCEVRGAFMVGDTPATADDVVFLAPKVSKRAAESAIKKMRELGMLEFDDELGGEWIHDWDKLNPAPKKDASNAERQARWRERNASRNAESNGHVTPPEVEGEVEVGKDPPCPPRGNRSRDKDVYEQDLREWAVALLPQAPPAEAFFAVKAAMSEAGFREKPLTRETVIAGVRKWRPELLPAEVVA